MLISKRDFFAAAALTGLLAQRNGGDDDSEVECLPRIAFKYADKMMQASEPPFDEVDKSDK